ncbi:MAG: EamA family transporter [Desulfovibrionaceae bacterium]|nr:EamA family transporter [Desulfovibrionaceae bacterium]
MANLARLGAGTTGAHTAAGLGLSILALACITHFLVANLLFLKARPHVSPVAWANAIGVSVLAISLAALALRPALLATSFAQAMGPSPGRYVLGCAVLGFGSSWLGAVLWNRANARLPAAVAGQCIVFWPVSGLIFAFIVQRRLPGLMEIAGIALVFAGIVWGLRAFAVRPAPPAV